MVPARGEPGGLLGTDSSLGNPVVLAICSRRGVGVMAGEQWARRILENELKRNVVVYDDGSKPSMYDLRVGPADAPEMAVECVAAVDPSLTETWNLGPAQGPLELALKGDWSITLTPSAQVNAIRQHVEPLLRKLEARGLRDVSVNHALKRYDSALFEELSSLEVTR
jgi:hypothetical protein